MSFYIRFVYYKMNSDNVVPILDHFYIYRTTAQILQNKDLFTQKTINQFKLLSKIMNTKYLNNEIRIIHGSNNIISNDLYEYRIRNDSYIVQHIKNILVLNIDNVSIIFSFGYKNNNTFFIDRDYMILKSNITINTEKYEDNLYTDNNFKNFVNSYIQNNITNKRLLINKKIQYQIKDVINYIL